MRFKLPWFVLVYFLLLAAAAYAGDRPYFITYDHTMEEPGSLEIETSGLTGQPKGGDTFTSGLMEFEYGAKGWWTLTSRIIRFGPAAFLQSQLTFFAFSSYPAPAAPTNLSGHISLRVWISLYAWYLPEAPSTGLNNLGGSCRVMLRTA